jgi:membrane protein required for colicin V production
MMDTHILNWADYVIIAIIAISILISLLRGFIREILSLATWIIAFIVGFKFSGKLAIAFAPYTQNSSLRVTISFAILFLIVLILGGLIGHLVAAVAMRGKLGLVDRTLGMIFGFLRGILVVAVLLLLITMSATKPDIWYKESYLIPHFQSLVNWMHDFLPKKIKDVSNDIADTKTGDVITPEVSP